MNTTFNMEVVNEEVAATADMRAAAELLSKSRAPTPTHFVAFDPASDEVAMFEVVNEVPKLTDLFPGLWSKR